VSDVDPEARKRRLKIAAAAAGAIVLVGGLAGIGIAALSGGDDTAAPSTSTPADDASAAPAPSPSEPAGDVADASVTERGWVPEPITTDPEAYGIAAAEALWSYDASQATHSEFIEWYTTWFSTRPDRTEEQRAASREDDEFGSSVRTVVTDSDGWRQQTLAGTVMTATADPEGVLLDDEHTDGTFDDLVAVGIHRVTVPLVVRYEETDTSTGEAMVYENRLMQSVQVTCGDADLPEDGSWPSGSCKVIQVWEEPGL
jgi:hypothetical protein